MGRARHSQNNLTQDQDMHKLINGELTYTFLL